jgi:hypothetical protein
VNGIAAELEFAHRTELSTKNTANMMPGQKNAVSKMFFSHFSPPIILYKRAEK